MRERENPTQEVFRDDARVVPRGWARAQPGETIALPEAGLVTEISLDRDLCDNCRTGRHVILWLDEGVALCGLVPPRIAVHSSANPAAAARIRAGIEIMGQLARRNGDQSQSRCL